MSSRTRRRRKRLKDEISRRTEPGAPAGTIIPDPEAPRSTLHVLAYGPDAYEEQQVQDLREIPPLLARWPVVWLNVDGIGDASLISQLGQLFGLHRLALEDVTHPHQRSKVEPFGTHYFAVTRMPVPGEPWVTEQVSFFFGERFLITFQQTPGGDCLDAVRTRIRSGWGRARTARPDCLLYALLDTIVDHYFPLIEEAGDRLDALEVEVAEAPRRALMPRLHAVKRDLLSVRRIMWPMRDAINTLMRDQSPLIAEETRVYLRDVQDHVIQIIDLVESFRDVASGLTEIHLSSVSQRTNETMKLLTIISTIFIPLTFLVGVYGMNFDPDYSPFNMPELRWYWGYPVTWAVMIGTALVMLYFFRRSGWFGEPKEPPPRSGE